MIDAVTGNPIYTPNAGYDGSDSFTYTVSDGRGATATATVAVTVVVANQAPVAVADQIALSQGGTATVLVSGATSVLANDTDADGDALQAILVTVPSHGTLTLNPNGTFSYVHNGSANPADGFSYRANDGTNDGNTVTVDITVALANRSPVAVDDNMTTPQNTTVEIALAALTSNDTDVDGDSLAVFATSAVVNGSLAVIGGKLYFTPANNFVGVGSFTYSIHDGNGGTASAVVYVTVTP